MSDANVSLMIAVVGSLYITQPQGMLSGKCFKDKHAAIQETASAQQGVTCVKTKESISRITAFIDFQAPKVKQTIG